MITDNELIRLLELADPARVDDPAPVLEPAEYRDALLAGRTPVRLVDLEPTPSEPSSGRRWLILTAAAAAVFVAIAVVVTHDDAAPADQPSPTVIVPPTVTPRALPNTPRTYAQLAPGTYFVDEVDGIPTPRIFATIGDGWWHHGDDGWLIEKREDYPGDELPEDPLEGYIGPMSFSHPIRVFSDVCHWEDGYYPGTLTTLDGLVNALTSQQGWAEVTAPSDISIDGYAGKAFQRTAPAAISDCDLVMSNTREDVRSWNPTLTSWETNIHSRAGYAAGSIETLWVLDIDGTVVVISTVTTPGPSAEASPEFAADVLDSIRIERA